MNKKQESPKSTKTLKASGNKKLLVAYNVSDPKNTAKKKHLEFDKQTHNETDLVAFFLDPSKLVSHDLYVSLQKKLKQSEKNYELDFDSFLKVCVPTLSESSVATVLAAAVEYANNLTPFSVKLNPVKVKKHDLKHSASYKNLVAEAQVVARAQTFARKLQDMPSNFLNPDRFVKEVKALFAPLGTKVKVNVLDYKTLLKKKMGLICGVGQGSNSGPYIVTLEYNNSPKSEKLALVGKGVCFDTGGYSLKTGGHMRNMKFDMSGAAAVATAVYALAKNGVKTNVVGVLGIVENLISLKAYRVDDALVSYSGLGVEVDNTDAEGRLVLADCLAYAAKDLKAKKLLSIATLTGAIIYALGATYAGGWATHNDDWKALKFAAEEAGEGLWRMPFHNDYLNLLKKSQVADLRNSLSSPLAGSSRAACFLKEFTNHLPYMHLDIAGVDSTPDAAGLGPFVRTLYALGKNHKA